MVESGGIESSLCVTKGLSKVTLTPEDDDENRRAAASGAAREAREIFATARMLSLALELRCLVESPF